MSLVGSKIGNILLEKRVGVGGMGEVYRGFDERLERSVAVKTIRADQRMSAEMKGRFLREARLLSRLEHPAICQVYDIIESSDADYLVLEFIDGETLRELIAPGLKNDQLLDLSEQIAAALEVAHGQHVVHRDLKPENIMVTPTGRVKVLDFGIARSLREELAPQPSEREPRYDLNPHAPTAALDTVLPTPRGATEIADPYNTARVVSAFATRYLTQAGSVIGTRYYMSPEQADGGALTEASDIYSFGVVLEDLLEAWRHSAQHASPAERSEIGELDPDVLVLIADLKSKEPKARPNATQARERIRAIIDKPAQLERRRRWLRVGAAASGLLFLLLALTSYLAWQSSVAKTLAEQRTRQAESLIGFVIGDLRKKLEPIGQLEVIDGIGERALAYYAQVPTDQLSETELNNLLDTLRQLAVVRMKRGDYESAGRFIERALALSRSRSEANKDSANWQSQLCIALAAHGQWQSERELPNEQILDTFTRSLESCERAVALAPSDREAKFELAVAHGNLAMARLKQGDGAAAESSFLTSNDLLAELIARLPGRIPYKEQSASNFAWLSLVYESTYRAADALNARRKNLALIDELIALEPDALAWREDRSVALNQLGMLQIALGDAAQAVDALTQALALVNAALKSDPSNISNRRAAAIIQSRLALLNAAKQPAPALLQAADARGALDTLLRGDPASPDYQRIEAQALLREAEIRLSLGAPESSLPSDLSRADTTFAALLARNPQDVESRIWRARGAVLLARVLRVNGDVDGSSVKAREAISELELIEGRRLSWEADWQRVLALELLQRREEAQSLRVRLKSRGFAPL